MRERPLADPAPPNPARGLCARRIAVAATRRRHVEDAARRFLERGDRPRSTGVLRHLLVRLCRAIFDPLYTYDYFARPVRLVPNTAESLPVVTDGGRTYTIKVKRGIYFAADPAFKGKPRELTAEDYVYSIKRIIDPKVRSYWLYLLEKNLVGSIRRARPGARHRHARLRDERSKGCRRSTATRCASASTGPTTRSSGGSRPSSSPRSRARSSTCTRTRATGSWTTRSARARTC